MLNSIHPLLLLSVKEIKVLISTFNLDSSDKTVSDEKEKVDTR